MFAVMVTVIEKQLKNAKIGAEKLELVRLKSLRKQFIFHACPLI
jgi:hypothetical protein